MEQINIKEAFQNIMDALAMYRGTLPEHQTLQNSLRIIATALDMVQQDKNKAPKIIPFTTTPLIK